MTQLKRCWKNYQLFRSSDEGWSALRASLTWSWHCQVCLHLSTRLRCVFPQSLLLPSLTRTRAGAGSEWSASFRFWVWFGFGFFAAPVSAWLDHLQSRFTLQESLFHKRGITLVKTGKLSFSSRPRNRWTVMQHTTLKASKSRTRCCQQFCWEISTGNRHIKYGLKKRREAPVHKVRNRKEQRERQKMFNNFISQKFM